MNGSLTNYVFLVTKLASCYDGYGYALFRWKGCGRVTLDGNLCYAVCDLQGTLCSLLVEDHGQKPWETISY